MKRFSAMAIAALMVTGCQIHSEEPTGGMVVAGEYKAVAECFYLKVRIEGFWKLEHFDTVNATEVTMGDARYRLGTVTFREQEPEHTSVLFQIPHPGKISRLVRECEVVS